MKNFKKVLSFVLAFAMVFSTMTISFAATSTVNDDKAEVLHDLGLFNGTSTEEFVPALDEEADAQQAIVLIGRALQWDVNMDATVSFTDVSDWAAPYIAYAVDNGITSGVSDTEFGSDVISGTRIVAWFLNALGYDISGDDWEDDTVTYAEEAGIDIPSDTLRDDVVGVIYEGLMTTPVDGDETLIETIVGDDEDLMEIAVEAGLMEETPDTFEIDSVEAPNLIQIVIELTNENYYDEDALTDEDNYDFEGTVDGDDDDLDIEDADLDGTTLTLTLETAVDNPSTGELTIDDNVFGEEITEDIDFSDTTLPEIVEAKVIGEDTIKLVFNEPLNYSEESDTDNSDLYDGLTQDESSDNQWTVDNSDIEDAFTIDVDGDDYNVDELTAMKNNTELNITVFGTLDEGTLTMALQGGQLEDFAGFALVTDDIEMAVVEDDEAPYVVDYTDAQPDEITLVFNEDIKIVDDDPDNFYHTNSSTTIDDTRDDGGYEVDGNELTLYFDEDDEMSEIAYVYVSAGALEDYWGNENDSVKEKVELTTDDDAPEVTDIDTEDYSSYTKIEITFDEQLDEDTAEDDDNYTLIDSDGDEWDIRNASYDVDDDDNGVVTLTTDDDLDDDTYELTIDDVEDKWDNAMDDYTISFDFQGDDAVELQSAYLEVKNFDSVGDEDNKYEIYLRFDQELTTDGTYDATDLSQYTLTDYDGTTESLEDWDDEDDTDVEVKLTDSNKTVVIKTEGITLTNAGADDTDNDDMDSDIAVTFGRLEDLDGNYTTAYSTTVYSITSSEDSINTDVDLQFLDASHIGFDDAEVDLDDDDDRTSQYIDVTFEADLDDVDEGDFFVIEAPTAAMADDTERESIINSLDEDEDTYEYDGVDYANYTIDSIEELDDDEIGIWLDDLDNNRTALNTALATEHDDVAIYVVAIDDTESEDSTGVTLQPLDYVVVDDGLAPQLVQDNDMNSDDDDDIASYGGNDDDVDRVFAYYDETADKTYIFLQFEEALSTVNTTTFDVDDVDDIYDVATFEDESFVSTTDSSVTYAAGNEAYDFFAENIDNEGFNNTENQFLDWTDTDSIPDGTAVMIVADGEGYNGTSITIRVSSDSYSNILEDIETQINYEVEVVNPVD